ncbi:MAG: hypothetical protein QW520_07140 [Methanomassiliicoccales archaeon]
MRLKKDHYLIIYAVLTAIIVVLAIALIPIISNLIEPEKEIITPQGEFGAVSFRSVYEIHVWFGQCNPSVNFTDCLLLIISPDNQRCILELSDSKLIYPLTGLFTKLTEIRISDSTSMGKIDAEDFLVLYHNYPLEKGIWNLNLIFKKTGRTIASRPLVSPDMDSHPTGDFISAYKIDNRRYRLEVGIISPPTDYSYCRLYLDPPGISEDRLPKYLDLGEGTEQIVRYSDEIEISITAQNRYGIPQSGDTIDIISTGTTLPFGQWTVALVSKFDGGRIAVKIFSIE